MACSDDSDDSVESVVVGIDFTVPGHTTWGPIGASSPSPSPPLPLESKEDRRRRQKRECEAKRRSTKAPKKKSKAAKKKAQTEKVQRHRSKKRAKSDTQATAEEESRQLFAAEQLKQRELSNQQLRRQSERQASRQERVNDFEEGRSDDVHATCSSARSTTIPCTFPAKNSPVPFSQATTSTVTPEATNNESEAEKNDETPSPTSTSRRTTLSDLLAPTSLFPVATNSKTH
eukprot:scaffold37122_cov34-Attheya_sp.AAC.1